MLKGYEDILWRVTLTGLAVAVLVIAFAAAGSAVLHVVESWQIYTGDSPCLVYRT